MKHVFSIIAAVLFCTIFIVPADGAPLKTYILWLVYSVCILWLVHLIMTRLEEDGKSHSGR